MKSVAVAAQGHPHIGLQRRHVNVLIHVHDVFSFRMHLREKELYMLCIRAPNREGNRRKKQKTKQKENLP